MKVSKVTASGTKSTVTVSDAVFAAPVNDTLAAQAVRVYRANQRQGTSKVQTRSEVSRTKAKLYRQKGTGNARHGSKNAPIFVGGGVAHGPSGEQNWSLQLPKAFKKQALATACTLQAQVTTIVESLTELSGKTKQALELVSSVSEKTDKVLVVLPMTARESAVSLFNIGQVRVVTAEAVTALEVLSADKILLHPDTISILESRVAQKARAPKKTETETNAQKPKKNTKTK